MTIFMCFQARTVESKISKLSAQNITKESGKTGQAFYFDKKFDVKST